MHIATRDWAIHDGKHCYGYGEARYTFTVAPLRNAVTWTNATGGFHPAEAPTVEITKIEYRSGRSKAWIDADGAFGDLLAEVPDKWLLEQIGEQEA